MKLKLNQDNHLDKPEGFDNIMFGHLGNGITVWDKNMMMANEFDYGIIATIDDNRRVEYKNYVIADVLKDYIEHYARTANPRVSSTQAEFVFREEAKLKPYYFTFGIGQKHDGKYVKIEGYTSNDARDQMTKLFDNKWSWQYTEEQWLGQGVETLAEKWGWTELII